MNADSGGGDSKIKLMGRGDRYPKIEPCNKNGQSFCTKLMWILSAGVFTATMNEYLFMQNISIKHVASRHGRLICNLFEIWHNCRCGRVRSSSETKAGRLWYTSSPSFQKVNLRIVTQVKIFWTGYKENFGANLSPDSLGV